MAIKRTVTKSKKDGVKKKTVTYKSKAGTVTRTKDKGKGGKGKTTTVSNKKGKMVGTASKAKTKPTGLVRRDAKATKKSKTVALGKSRTASTEGLKGRAYYGKVKKRTVTSGGSGDTYSRTDKDKFGQVGQQGKRKSTTRGTTKQVVSRGSMKSGMAKATGGTKVAGMKTATKRGRGPIKRRK
jgi:hypothetical protein